MHEIHQGYLEIDTPIVVYSIELSLSPIYTSTCTWWNYLKFNYELGSLMLVTGQISGIPYIVR